MGLWILKLVAVEVCHTATRVALRWRLTPFAGKESQSSRLRVEPVLCLTAVLPRDTVAGHGLRWLPRLSALTSVLRPRSAAVSPVELRVRIVGPKDMFFADFVGPAVPTPSCDGHRESALSAVSCRTHRRRADGRDRRGPLLTSGHHESLPRLPSRQVRGDTLLTAFAPPVHEVSEEDGRHRIRPSPFDENRGTVADEGGCFVHADGDAKQPPRERPGVRPGFRSSAWCGTSIALESRDICLLLEACSAGRP